MQAFYTGSFKNKKYFHLILFQQKTWAEEEDKKENLISIVRDAAENGLCVALVDAAENDENCDDEHSLAHSLMSWGSEIMGGESDEDDVALVACL